LTTSSDKGGKKNRKTVYRMEYFVRQIGELSGSVILILALLIGLSVGWFLRGQININSAGNEQVS